ncbi:DUF4340 domain-containing protein [Corallococcus carmarthensis]|uniref:DUF4340 domain-containing protein n=1 Tax=Corallococcus carmarthensis TaxID=2316728 RepID=UPI00148DDD0B|nr:DUF4340 domain-containing protein [Corallococcus carmarthensis]
MRTSTVVMLGLMAMGPWACSRDADKPAAPPKLFATGAEEPRRGAPPAPAPVFTHLTVKARGATTELERTPEGWRLLSPVEAKADAYVMEALLKQLSSAKFKATVNASPSEADLKKYGLTSPTFTVTARAWLPDANGEGAEDPSRQRTVTLVGGDENPFDGSVYVRREGDAAVYAADGAVRYALDKGPFELRDKAFLGQLDLASLQSMEVTAKNNAYVLMREPDGMSWRVEKPTQTRANAPMLKGTLMRLAEQQALSFPQDTAATREALGLDTPVVDARFVPVSGEPIRIRMAQVTRDGEPVVHVLREQGTRSTLAQVEARTLTLLDVDIQELRDRRVLVFQRDAVRRLEFHPGGQAAPVVVTRGAGNSDAWQVEGPGGGRALPFRMVKVLAQLEGLRTARFVEAKVERWEPYGITAASQRVVLRDADGRELARLWVGNAVPGMAQIRYARGSGPDLVMVYLSQLANIPTRAADFLEPPPADPDGGAPAP